MIRATKSTRSKRGVLGALLLAVAIPAGYGCMATTEGSGSTTPVSITSTGTESTLPHKIEDVAATTQQVLAQNGVVIADSESKKHGDEREFKGKVNGLDVTVTLERKGPEATKVEVSAQKNLIEWNKDFAKKINEEIAAKA